CAALPDRNPARPGFVLELPGARVHAAVSPVAAARRGASAGPRAAGLRGVPGAGPPSADPWPLVGRGDAGGGSRLAMKHSATRILTTHVGSLPRPADVIERLLEVEARRGADRAALDSTVRRAVVDVVRRQAACGLDVINDGEQGRVDYTVYLKDRL